MSFKNLQKYIFLGTILIIADQISKSIIFDFLTTKPSGSISILPFFNLTLVINKGVSFGLLNNMPYPEYIISFIVLCIICFLFFLFVQEDSAIKKVALILLISGAIGNTIDRFIYGGVVDFLDFHAGAIHYPAFNIADSVIFIGVVTLIFPNIIKKILRLKNL